MRHPLVAALWICVFLCGLPMGMWGAVETAPQIVLSWEGWFTIAVFIAVFFLLVREVFPAHIVMLFGAGTLVVFGIIPTSDFLRSFSRDIVFTLCMLFIIARALEVRGVLHLIAKHLLPKTHNRIAQLFMTMLPLSAASAFLNNTPIVLMLTPVIRRWSLEQGSTPSKFLIPISYAAILGGTCTLIGTSVNLVVDGLLRAATHGNVSFSFFELAWVGVPCVVVGTLYIVLIGRHLLPRRQDPTTNVSNKAQEFTGEFLITEECELANKTILEASKSLLRNKYLIEIEREGRTIDAPSAQEELLVGDRLVFAGEIAEITALHSIKGLQSQADPHFSINVDSTHFSEVVISMTSSLIGKTLRNVNFRQQYGASVIAIYRQGKRLRGAIRDTLLHAGDTLMLLSPHEWYRERYGNDFYYIRLHEKVPVFILWRTLLVVGILFAMIAAVMTGTPLLKASLIAVAGLFVTRSITIREARKGIPWHLLVLIACAFALGAGVEKAGVASYFAESILPWIGGSPWMLIAGIFIMTVVTTEVITNNAAALLLFPIALQTGVLAGYDTPSAIKAIAVTVAMAASCSFVTPIGYQTNTIVYGPGGYRFTDYMKVGFPLSLLILALCVWLIPHLWPLS